MQPTPGVQRGPRVSIRYPFDSSFPPFPQTPANFVADGNAQPPGGPGFTVQGTLYDDTDLMLVTPLSNTITVNVGQGVWSMGPFTQVGTANPMLLGTYQFRVKFMEGVAERDNHVITITLF